MSNKTALVFGASGISGYSLLHTLLTYPPANDTFSRVIGLTSRPLNIRAAQLPHKDPRLVVVSGLDLLDGGLDDAVEVLREVNEDDLKSVTHVYYAAYKATKDPTDYKTLREQNVKMLATAIKAVAKVAPNLEFWVLQTGSKAYGVEFPDQVEIKAPLKESAPRIPEPWRDNIFYYAQVDVLQRASEGKSWKWCEVRPDVIVGFVPHSNAMNIAHPVALYLILHRHLNGPNSAVPFPGTVKSWKNKHTDTRHDILARFEVYCSLHPDKTAGESFNIADHANPITWEAKWPKLCSYFGLVGVGPVEGAQSPSQWMKEHEGDWRKFVERQGLDKTTARAEGSEWQFFDQVVGPFDFDRQLDLSKARSIGFMEEVDTVEGFKLCWERMKQAGMLPKNI